MTDKEFSLRLSKLREQKGVSARDMSLSIGQNEGYINSIERGKTMPSLSGLYYICDYLNITPAEFFDVDSKCPETLSKIVEDLKTLDQEQLNNVAAIVNALVKK